jgi:lipoyl(octanoyl) transferase
LNLELPFSVIDLGQMAYAAALEAQRRAHQGVVDGTRGPTLFLVEHDPVITVSRRRSAPGHVLADRARLAELGIDVRPTDRGGDVTYHGPGQLVVYPILRLRDLRLTISGYMRLLEQVAIDTAGAFGVEAFRVPGMTGVWVAPRPAVSGLTPRATHGDEPPALQGATGAAFTAPAPAKLCALGVRISRGVTMHGLAFNVTTDLAHFQTIVPCGLADRGVASLAELLGRNVPPMRAVKGVLVEAMARQVRVAMISGVTDVGGPREAASAAWARADAQALADKPPVAPV